MSLTARTANGSPAQAADRARSMDGPPGDGRSTGGPSTARRSRTALPGRRATASSPSARADVAVPADWPLEETRLDLDLGGEGRLSASTYDDGKQRRFRARPQPPPLPCSKARAFSARSRMRRPPALRRAATAMPSGQDARSSGWRPALADFILLLRQVVESRRGARRSRGRRPMLSAAEDAFARLDWPSATRTLCRPGAVDAPSSSASGNCPTACRRSRTGWTTTQRAVGRRRLAGADRRG